MLKKMFVITLLLYYYYFEKKSWFQNFNSIRYYAGNNKLYRRINLERNSVFVKVHFWKVGHRKMTTFKKRNSKNQMINIDKYRLAANITE